jgi:hypothetical protein
MPERQTLHIFHDGSYWFFGYTEDRTGGNLPRNLLPQDVPARSWVFYSTIEVLPGEEPRAGMDVDDVQFEIRQHGFCVKENVIGCRYCQHDQGHSRHYVWRPV